MAATSPAMTESEVAQSSFTPTTSLRRHHGHARIFGANAFRYWREVQRGAALVGAAAGDEKAMLTGNDVALAQRRVVVDLDGRQPDLVTAVAGAARDQFGAVAKRIRQVGIRI